MKHYVIELFFDQKTEDLLRNISSELSQLKTIESPYSKPHISLSSFQSNDKVDWKRILEDIKPTKPFPITFSYKGIFGNDPAIIYLGVTPTTEILGLHTTVHQQTLLNGTQLHPLYYPNSIIFHSSLIGPISKELISSSIERIMSLQLPSEGMIEKIALVEYFPEKILEEVSLQ